MFIDDERFPPDNGKNWFICRNMMEVKQLIRIKGFPVFCSFDHDLGENEPTGYDIVKWMVECDMNNSIIPYEFTFYVHSQNPVGAKNIREYLNNYLMQMSEN